MGLGQTLFGADSEDGETSSLVLIDSITVTGSAVTTVTFGPGGDGVNNPTLDGDNDGDYVIIGNILGVPSNSTYRMEPNSIQTNQESVFIFGNGASRSGGGDSNLMVWRSSASTQTGYFEAYFTPTTGQVRHLISGTSIKESTTAADTRWIAGIWDETATNVTSLEIHGPTNGIGVGSTFSLYTIQRIAS